MSEFIGHECGLAFVRLRKPINYFEQKYHDVAWGLHKLYLLMEKQRNRGQDGVGLAVMKFDMPPGTPFLHRTRSAEHNAIAYLFNKIMTECASTHNNLHTTKSKYACKYVGEMYLGHLRYGTFAGQDTSYCQPFICKNTIAAKNFALAGNFNMTNTAQLFEHLIQSGLHPTSMADSQIILECIAHALEQEYERTATDISASRKLTGPACAHAVAQGINITRMMRNASHNWDGGYVFAGMFGNGDAFICKDPAGIRPGFYYIDNEVIAAASERAALMSVFNAQPEQIHSIKPGHLLVIKRNGYVEEKQFLKPLAERHCVFERIYFSRENDPDIYKERKNLGKQLAPRILKILDNDVDDTIFSYIPNSGHASLLGLIKEVEKQNTQNKIDKLWPAIEKDTVTKKDLQTLCNVPRAELIAYKDQLMRTFITQDDTRKNLVRHIYDMTKGVVQKDDTLVILDDSIVRGTTLKESIIRQLIRLQPKRIIIVSSCPPIMYPDCYGIDMSQIGRLIAFKATISLLKEHNNKALIEDVKQQCIAQQNKPHHLMKNFVKDLYASFTLEQLSKKITELVTPDNIDWHGEIQIMYQTIEDMNIAIPHHTGDWVFTGNYPTPGGYNVLNQSFLHWCAGSDARAYENFTYNKYQKQA